MPGTIVNYFNNSFNPHSTPSRLVLLFVPFYREDRSPGRLSDVPEILKLGSCRAESQIEAGCLHSLSSLTDLCGFSGSWERRLLLSETSYPEGDLLQKPRMCSLVRGITVWKRDV